MTSVGINGFGRIGRDFLRAALERRMQPIEVVAINDITAPETMAHLLRYDSTYGPLRQPVTYADGTMLVDDWPIRVTAERDPAALDWRAAGVDIVIEATGKFRTRDAAAAHLAAGARNGDFHCGCFWGSAPAFGAFGSAATTSPSTRASLPSSKTTAILRPSRGPVRGSR